MITYFLLYAKDDFTDELEIVFKTPTGETSYPVKVIKESDFDVEKIFENNLFMLLPFYLFNYKRKLAKINKDEKALEKLEKEYEDILDRLDGKVENGELSAISKGVIISLTKSVTNKLAHKYENVNRKVGDMMGGRVLKLDIIEDYRENYRRGLADGRADGRAEGEAAGIAKGEAKRDREMIESMLRKGKEPEDIADFCGYPLELVKEVQAKMLVTS